MRCLAFKRLDVLQKYELSTTVTQSSFVWIEMTIPRESVLPVVQCVRSTTAVPASRLT
jgi:hypothetical protein